MIIAYPSNKRKNHYEKIINMNYEDAAKAYQAFSKKHPIDDDFDMNFLIINEVRTLLNNKNFANTIYDVYCYGFMSGTKQAAAETKKEHDKIFAMSSEKHHRDLVELAYNLPFGTGADYFYTFMVLMLNKRYNGIEELLPAKQRKLFEETVAQYEEEHPDKIEYEKDAPETFLDNKGTKKQIIDKINSIDDEWILNQIYRFAINMTK